MARPTQPIARLKQVLPMVGAAACTLGALGLTAFVFNGGLPVTLSADPSDLSMPTDRGEPYTAPRPGLNDPQQVDAALAARTPLSTSPTNGMPENGTYDDTVRDAWANLLEADVSDQLSGTPPDESAQDWETNLIDPVDTHPHAPPRVPERESTLVGVVPQAPDTPSPQSPQNSGGGGVMVATAGSGGGGGSGSLSGRSGGGSGGGGGGGGANDAHADAPTSSGGLSDGTIGNPPAFNDPAEAWDHLEDGVDLDAVDTAGDPAVIPDEPIDPDTHIKPLVLFDAYYAMGSPDLVEDHGYQPIVMLYAGRLWEPGEPRDEPNLPLIRERAAAVADGSLVCVDIEEWELRLPFVTLEEAEANIDKLVSCMQAVREGNPTLIIGMYRLMPTRNFHVPAYYYWLNRADKPHQFTYDSAWMDREATWHANNARVDRLAEHVDVIFPSLYTFTENPDQWEVYARMNMEQARRYGKPVYPFIWPTYRIPGTPDQLPVSAEMWERQLRVLHHIADGIVIWGSSFEHFNPSDGWWEATTAYQQEVDDSPLVFWGD
jgi:hypothetical protein